MESNLNNKKTQLCAFNKSSPHPIKLECFHGTIEAYGQKSPMRSDKSEDGHFIFSHQNNTFLGVADGVGGCPHGQQASALVLQIVHEELLTIRETDTRKQVTKKITQAFHRANRELLIQYPESATTLILAWIKNNSVQFFYSGDSEGFVIDAKGNIKYRTIPHTPAGEEVSSKKISWEKMATHPERNIVTNYLGFSEMVVDIPPSFILNEEDTIVVCSDGLTDNFAPHELTKLSAQISMRDTISRVREKMISSQDGKPDDCTILRFKLKKVA